MIKRMVIMLLAVAVVFGGIFGFQVFKAAMIKKFIAALSNPPQTISATTAATSEWQPQIEAIGSLRAVRGAERVVDVNVGKGSKLGREGLVALLFAGMEAQILEEDNLSRLERPGSSFDRRPDHGIHLGDRLAERLA